MHRSKIRHNPFRCSVINCAQTCCVQHYLGGKASDEWLLREVFIEAMDRHNLITIQIGRTLGYRVLFGSLRRGNAAQIWLSRDEQTGPQVRFNESSYLGLTLLEAWGRVPAFAGDLGGLREGGLLYFVGLRAEPPALLRLAAEKGYPQVLKLARKLGARDYVGAWLRCPIDSSIDLTSGEQDPGAVEVKRLLRKWLRKASVRGKRQLGAEEQKLWQDRKRHCSNQKRRLLEQVHEQEQIEEVLAMIG